MLLFKNRARQTVARQLAMLLESDVRPHKAIQLAALQQTNVRWQRALTKMSKDLYQGDPLSSAMRYSGLFRPGDVEVVHWAEEQGGPKDLVIALRLIAGDHTPVETQLSDSSVRQEDSIDLFASATGMERRHIHLL